VGQIRSKTYAQDVTINGVMLGQPTIVNADLLPAGPGDDLTACWWLWDDSRIPTGELIDGQVIPDPDPQGI
jgi:hypothetical protein